MRGNDGPITQFVTEHRVDSRVRGNDAGVVKLGKHRGLPLQVVCMGLWIWLVVTALVFGSLLWIWRAPMSNSARPTPLPNPGVLNGEHLARVLEQYASASGWFEPQRSRWMARIILESGAPIEQIVQRILRHGPALAAEHYQHYGLDPRLKLGQAVWQALNEHGRADPGTAVLCVVQRALGQLNREQDLVELRQRRVTQIGIHTEVHGCAAVRASTQQAFAIHEAPPLPVTSCDAEYCLCSYRQWVDYSNAGKADHSSA